GAESTKSLPSWLVEARSRLELRYDEPWTIRSMARAANVHPVHFIRMFRRGFGRTPREFLRERRLNVAMSLLRLSDLPVADAPVADMALRWGFADQAHLTRSFTRGFGVPPARYRRVSRADRTLIPDKTRSGIPD